MTIEKTWVGIDVSKDVLGIYVLRKVYEASDRTTKSGDRSRIFLNYKINQIPFVNLRQILVKYARQINELNFAKPPPPDERDKSPPF
jgi:hypothetical protein